MILTEVSKTLTFFKKECSPLHLIITAIAIAFLLIGLLAHFQIISHIGTLSSQSIFYATVIGSALFLAEGARLLYHCLKSAYLSRIPKKEDMPSAPVFPYTIPKIIAAPQPQKANEVALFLKEFEHKPEPLKPPISVLQKPVPLRPSIPVQQRFLANASPQKNRPNILMENIKVGGAQLFYLKSSEDTSYRDGLMSTLATLKNGESLESFLDKLVITETSALVIKYKNELFIRGRAIVFPEARVITEKKTQILKRETPGFVVIATKKFMDPLQKDILALWKSLEEKKEFSNKLIPLIEQKFHDFSHYRVLSI